MFTLKSPALLATAFFSIFAACTAFAADNLPPDNQRLSQRIDDQLQRTASDLTREIDVATRQQHEADRLGISRNIRNVYGTQNEVDRNIQRSVDEANNELRDAAARDEYTFQRRELENNRSIYSPNSREFNQLTDRINQLDRDFTSRSTSMR